VIEDKGLLLKYQTQVFIVKYLDKRDQLLYLGYFVMLFGKRCYRLVKSL